jgi:predicted dehydrogenase
LSLKVGVIGVGYLGQHHARIYSEIEDAELVAVVDTDRERAAAFAEKYGCSAYSDFREILPQVDALSIVTPTLSHYLIALECLRAGKDILVEKPITGIVREADELIVESAKRGCILQVGHLERYNPAVYSVFEVVKKPRFIESERLSPFLGRGIDVDVTVDLMIHDADIILGLVSSPVKEMKAVGAKVFTDKIDFAKAWLEFDNGCIAVLTASRVSPDKQRTLKIFQKDSYFSIDYQQCEIRRSYRTAGGMVSDFIKADQKEPLKEELKDFVRCVKERRRPKVSAIEGREALKLVLDITETIRRKDEKGC